MIDPNMGPDISCDGTGSHVVFSLQETKRYKVVSIDNHHNSHSKALDHVAKIARDALLPDASERDRDSAEIDAQVCDLTSPAQVRKVFEKYGKGGIWGVIHIAVCSPVSLFRVLHFDMCLI